MDETRFGRSSVAASAAKRRLLPLCLLGLGYLSTPQNAFGYAEEVHQQLALRALQNSGLSDTAAPLNLVAAAAVRSSIDTYARATPALHNAWIKRYPNPSDFDDWAFKYFLLLEPAGKPLYGIDRLDEHIGPTTKLYEILGFGSRHPDDDWRNRERLAYSPQRVPIKDKQGGPVPADPALLNMGKLNSLSSQAHAHYGLAQVEFSDDPEVLKTDPRRFGKRAGFERAPIITLAAEMMQEHTDLALLAALSDAPSAREMSWLYLGQGFHYLEDVGNQIHTVQVGLYDFFQDAFFERLKLGLLTGGGYLGTMRSLGSIGIDILSNHHVLSEHLTQKRLMAAVNGKGDADGQQLLLAPTQDDPAFAAQLDAALAALGPAPERGEYGLAITRALIEVSSHEGDAIYRDTRAIANPVLRTRQGHYDDATDDPDQALVPRSEKNEATYKDFFSLQERAFHRVGTALRRVVAMQQKALAGASTPEERTALRTTVLNRLITRQLKMLDAQDARLADYLQNPPDNATQPEHSPAMLAADLALLAIALLGLRYIVRRLKKS